MMKVVEEDRRQDCYRVSIQLKSDEAGNLTPVKQNFLST